MTDHNAREALRLLRQAPAVKALQSVQPGRVHLRRVGRPMQPATSNEVHAPRIRPRNRTRALPPRSCGYCGRALHMRASFALAKGARQGAEE